jgi:hypothetical protein
MPVTCSTPTRPSYRWSLLIELAAYAEDASRSQSHEQMTSKRGFTVLVKDHGPPPPPQPPATNPRPAR